VDQQTEPADEVGMEVVDDQVVGFGVWQIVHLPDRPSDCASCRAA
jgi:hypothetical protein